MGIDSRIVMGEPREFGLGCHWKEYGEITFKVGARKKTLIIEVPEKNQKIKRKSEEELLTRQNLYNAANKYLREETELYVSDTHYRNPTIKGIDLSTRIFGKGLTLEGTSWLPDSKIKKPVEKQLEEQENPISEPEQ